MSKDYIMDFGGLLILLGLIIGVINSIKVLLIGYGKVKSDYSIKRKRVLKISGLVLTPISVLCFIIWVVLYINTYL